MKKMTCLIILLPIVAIAQKNYNLLMDQFSASANETKWF